MGLARQLGLRHAPRNPQFTKSSGKLLDDRVLFDGWLS
jgi:hypothetical protein